MALTDGLIYASNFNGNADDLVGTNDGVVTGATNSIAAGKLNEGYNFTGSPDQIDFGTFSGVRTIAFWVKLDSTITSTTSPGTAFFGKDSSNYFLYAGNVTGGIPNEILTFVASGTATWYWTNTQIASFGTTYQLIVLKFPTISTARVSIDGAPSILATNTTGTPTVPTFTDMVLGSRDGDFHLSGNMDMLFIWNREITDAECSELWNGGDALEYPFSVTPTITNNPFFGTEL